MHLIDFTWAVLSVAAAAVPAYRLYDNLHRPGAPYLLGLVVVCAFYPWAYIVYPRTVLDQGLVFAFTSWIGPLYLLSVIGYLGVESRLWPWVGRAVLAFAAGMSLLAIANPLHGRFATFAQPTAAEPLTTTGQLAHGIGLSTMGGFSIACIIASVVLIGFHYRRSRFQTSHLVAMTLFPVASGCAYMLQSEIKAIVPEEVNVFILCTTAGLVVLTYTLLRSRFLELRPIARELVLNLIPDAVAIVTRTGVVMDCNTRFAGLIGESVRSAVGSELEERLPEEAWRLDDDAMARRAVRFHGDDSARVFDVHLAALEDGRAEVLVLARDVTEQTLAREALERNQAELSALNAELARLSNTDSLTGLRNRRYFFEQLAQERERSAREDNSFGVLSIDLDDFKRINDSYGHAVGDEALVLVARVMETQCRAVDTLARVGGEEFMVLLLGVDETELAQVGERFRSTLENAAVALSNGERLTVTASIGGALIRPETDVQVVLREIDDALYEAKRGGRNRVALRSMREGRGLNRRAV